MDDTRRERFNLSRWALEHSALTRYLLFVLTVLGLAAYFQLGQDEDPPFTFRAMVVRAMWPGASAQQVAEQVTDRIEKTLQEVPYADKIRSYTKPGESTTIFQVRDASPPAAVAELWYTVRKKIGDARSAMPQGVVGLFFNDEFGDVYGTLVALSGEGFTPAERERWAERVRDRLLQVKDVAKVELFGVQRERITVEIPQRRLAQLGLDPGELVGQLEARNAVAAAGVVRGRDDALRVDVASGLSSLDDIRRLPLRVLDPATGTAAQFVLGDVAQVRRGPSEPASVRVRDQAREVIALGVSMSRGGDILALGDALGTALERIRAELPAGLRLEKIQDQPQAVSRSVGEFVKVLLEAVAIVLAVSFVSLGVHLRPLRIDVRPGLVVAATIPVVLAVTFLVMYYWGVGLHKISLGSLIIALGLLVDDAIIAVEMMVRKLEEGYDRFHAATAAYELTAMPMLTGTLITAVGFLPIGMARSTVGEYTFAIFAVTAAALLISWFVSVFFVPWLGLRLLRAHPAANPADGPREVFDTPFYAGFRRLVGACVRHRWLTIAATLLLLGAGVYGMSKVQQQFFPDSNRPELLVDLWLPEGSTLAASEAVARRFEKRLLAEPGVARVTSWVGSGVPRFYLPLDVIFAQDNVSQTIVLPESLAARERLRTALARILAEEFSDVRARVKLLPNGPPVPYPVQFRVAGPDPVALRAYADTVRARMRADPDLRGVNDNWNEAIKTVRLEVDAAKARALGVTSQSIAQATQAQFDGARIGQFREADKLIDIVLTAPESERRALADLGGAYVRGSGGRAIPLAQIATPTLVFEPGVMWRENRRYAITVQADVRDGVQGATATARLLPDLERIAAAWPDGYRLEVAGAVEESSKGQGSILVNLPVMLFAILTLLMLQLQSFSRAVLVLLTGPLGIAGVAGALLLLDRPFGFVAMLGFIALMGMIMRNSVILVDQIEQDRARGLAAWDAIVESTVRRARPIVLTAAAAVLAMIPLTRSVFWGPMAVAIMGGLVVATLLTLLSLPAMYAAWFRVPTPAREAAAPGAAPRPDPYAAQPPRAFATSAASSDPLL